MKISPKQIMQWIQLVILILRYGKDVISTIGDIVDEVKDWFKKDPTERNKWKAKNEIKQRIEPLISASKGRYATSKELNDVADLMLKVDGDKVKKMTKKRGKSARRTS
jgi:hypothetical protein